MNIEQRKELYSKFVKKAQGPNVPIGATLQHEKVIPEALGSALKTTALLTTIGLSLGLGTRYVPKLISRLQANRALNKILKEGNYTPEQEQKILEAYSILYKYSPVLAEHPTVLKSFVEGILNLPSHASLHKVVMDLIQSEENVLRGVSDPALKAGLAGAAFAGSNLLPHEAEKISIKDVNLTKTGKLDKNLQGSKCFLDKLYSYRHSSSKKK